MSRLRLRPLPPGTYVVAVSGGVDSVVLLDILAHQTGLALVVAHFDHGIRPDSSLDAQFVKELAAKYQLPFVTQKVTLGKDASEATARQARYAFLRRVAADKKAVLVTAHHQDDVVETACINLIRGTGWRGLSSLRDTATARRPLLDVRKYEIIRYAREQQLPWHEDSTNQDAKYLRNHMRVLLAKDSNAGFVQEMLALIVRQNEIRQEADSLIQQITAQLVQAPGTPDSFKIRRYSLIALPSTVAKEVLLALVYKLTNKRVLQQTLSRMLWFAKTARPHKTLQVNAHVEISTTKTTTVVSTK